jgi:hypothetical protein
MSSLLLGPLKRYVGELLRSYLSTYIIGIELEAIGFFGSEVILNDLELATDALNCLLPLESPIELASGFVKSLRIYIPWTAILSAPVSITLDTVEVVARGRRHSSSAGPGTAASGPAASAIPDWLLGTLTRIAGNATVSAMNVIVRLQHADVECTLTMQVSRCAWTILLQRASLYSADPDCL